MRIGTIAAALVSVGLALSLAGCGVRGTLEHPNSKANETATAESGQGKPENAAPKPHKGFILDDLIR